MNDKKRGGTTMRITLTILLIVIILFLIIYANHKFRLHREAELLTPLGQLVEVGGNHMSVYIEGGGETTLVFLSGAGTCSPILDFKSLYTLLSDTYQIAVVEKFGYGFSDIVDKSRDIDVILEDTRAALTAAGLEAPYVLCPHSMSGLEALYWAQKYPDEVSAIIGLDMAVPQYYDDMKINMLLMRVSGMASRIGITRLLPGIAESDAIRHGTLTEEEKEIYRAVFYSRTATVPMLNEAEAVKENAKKVGDMEIPGIPMLLFLSNGSGGTGFEKEAWRQTAIEYVSRAEQGEYIALDCPHYVHNYEYERIAEETAAFLHQYVRQPFLFVSLPAASPQ